VNAKRKGTRNEHRSMALLEAAGYACTRAAASLGVFDIVGIGPTDVVLVQCKTRDYPGAVEMEAIRNFPAPANCRKLIHRWRDRQQFISGFPDVTFELRSSFANGTGGSAEWVMRGTHKGDLPGLPATGKRMDVRGASIFEFSGNKIRRCSDYWDMATLLNQLGLAHV
jgi:hypothetical protein